MNKKLIIAFIAFAVIGIGIFFILTTGNVGVQYNTAEVVKGQAGQFVEDVGTISSKNIRRYYGQSIGKIENLTVELGDHVEKGQLLIKYEDDLSLEIEKVEKQIESLEAKYNEILAGTDASSVSSARLEISKIRTDLDQAKTNKDRTQTLYDSGAVSLKEVEQTNNEVDKLQSSLGIAQNTYAKLTKDISENVKKQYETEIDVLILSLELLESKKDDYSIYADVDGIVTELNTFKGDTPSLGHLILEIQDPTEKVILVDFMTEDARLVKPDMTARIQDHKLDIYIDGLTVNKVYPKAFVTLSELGVEENRQTVEIELSESAEAFAYGLEVDTQVMVEAPREVLLVPTGAVIVKNASKYVKVLDKGEVVEREIVTGIRIDGNTEVIEGLLEGELVILNYQEEGDE